jgi:hypothetical protein
VTDRGRLGLRTLNRATLGRQFLLGRHPLSAQQAVRHLAGMQALSGFTPDALSSLLTERAVVRAPAMRATVHLIDAGDFVAFRPLFGQLMGGVLRANYGRSLAGVDPAALAAEAAELLAARPLTRAQLGKALAVRWPGADPMSLAYAVTSLVPVVQVPPRGIWGKSAQATWASAEAWLARPLPDARPAAAGELVRRYLAAFGPASVNDIQAWSGLTRLREITDRLDLRTYRGPEGAELLDLPDVPLPEEDVPAPPRFLPEYDNLLLSHADRSRVIPHDRPIPLLPGNGGTQGTLLIDGFWNAAWKITGEVLLITPFRPLTPGEEAGIEEEGTRLLRFAAPNATSPDIRFAAP